MELAGVLLLHGGGSPAAANAVGRFLLNSRDWPRIHAEIRSRLTQASAESVFALSRMNRRAPWVVRRTKLSGSPVHAERWHLCCIFEFERQHEISMGMLRELYAFTRAKMCLIEQILLGKTPGEATALGVTIRTVRTYLKGLYHKAGARCQAALVRKLIQASSSPVLPAA